MTRRPVSSGRRFFYPAVVRDDVDGGARQGVAGPSAVFYRPTRVGNSSAKPANPLTVLVKTMIRGTVTFAGRGVFVCLLLAGVSFGCHGGQHEGGEPWAIRGADTGSAELDAELGDVETGDTDEATDSDPGADTRRDSGRIDDPVDVGPEFGYGIVKVRQRRRAEQQPASQLRGQFGLQGFGWGTDDCETTTRGSCLARVCSDAEARESDDSRHAGEIHVAGPDAQLTVAPGSGSFQYSEMLGSRLWRNGDTVTVRAEGDEVPAFRKTLEPAADVQLLVPELPARGESLVVDTDSDLVVRWETDGVVGGEILWRFLALNRSGEPPRSVRVSCEFDAEKGLGTVPSAMLERFREDSEGDYAVAAGVREKIWVGDNRVKIDLRDAIGDGDDTTEDGTGDVRFE